MKKTLICIISILLCAPYAFAAEVGKVTYVDGRADILKTGSDMAIPIREGEIVSAGDSVRTKSNSKAEVTFKDNSVVRLAQNSRVEIKEYEFDKNNKRKTATIKLDRGKARTIISKTADAAEFNILTPNAEGKVRGSDIFTFYQAGASGILVAEGRMELKNVAHPEVSLLVPAGTSAFVNLEESPKGPRPYMDMEKKMHEQDTSIPASARKFEETSVIKGVVVKLLGKVMITSRGAALARPAELNDIIGEGDYIETGDSGLIEIKFDNGCGLNLKPNTQIKITRLVIDPKTGEYQNQFEASQGKIKARIENLKGRSTFEVKTPTAICGARGTFMYIDITPQMAKAFFEGGNGYIKNLISGAETDIDMGYNASADNQGNTSNPAPASNEERDNWTQGWDSDNGTSGYSSGGSNDNLGNVGDNSGGNNNINNANNNSGTTDNNNGNAGVYIPPENKNSNPAPTTTPETPAISMTGTFSKGGSESEGDYAFAHYDPKRYELIFDSGSMKGKLYGTGDLWSGSSMPFVLLGNYSNPGNRQIWGIDNLTGVTSDGATYRGVIGGIINEAARSIEGLLYAFYIRPSADGYRMGYLRSVGMAGGVGAAPEYGNIFGLTGYITRYLDQLTSISPDKLDNITYDEHDSDGYIGGILSGNAYCDTARLPGNDWGLWKGGLGGTFDRENPPVENSWKAVVGGSQLIEEGVSYWYGHINGARWSDHSLTATVLVESLSFDNYGRLSGDMIGVYGDDGTWQAVAAGVITDRPLGKNDSAGLCSNGIYQMDPETREPVGLSYGRLGVIGPIWDNGRVSDFISIGSITTFKLSPDYAKPFLWFSKNIGSLNPRNADQPGTTYDGGAFYGVNGCIGKGGKLEGLAIALYIDPDGKAGILKGDIDPELSGYSSDINMYIFKGKFTNAVKGTTSILPKNLVSGIIRNQDTLSGFVNGKFNGSGSVSSGDMDGFSWKISDCKWGMWAIEMSGNYYNPNAETGWKLTMGGYVTDRNKNITGHWLGTASGDWQNGDMNKISGQYDGFYISHTDDGNLKAGTVTGEVLGNYIEVAENSGAWQAVAAGEWVEAVTLLAATDPKTNQDNLAKFNTDLMAKAQDLNIPITEVYASAIMSSTTGTVGIVSAAMNMNLYATTALDQNGIWASLINGSFSGPVSVNWTASVANGADSAQLAQGTWNAETHQWTAGVTGNVGGASVNGQASGTFTGEASGTFTGAGTGTWSKGT